MKIGEQGFSERISGQASQPVAPSGAGRGSNGGYPQSVSDTLQLSRLASSLQQGSAADTDRAARLSRIAQAVQSNTFQISPQKISSALVSEAIQGRGY